MPSLAGVTLKPSGAVTLAHGLRWNSTLSKVCLVHNDIGFLGAAAICCALTDHPRLHKLEIIHNMGSQDEGYRQRGLAEEIRQGLGMIRPGEHSAEFQRKVWRIDMAVRILGLKLRERQKAPTKKRTAPSHRSSKAHGNPLYAKFLKETKQFPLKPVPGEAPEPETEHESAMVGAFLRTVRHVPEPERSVFSHIPKLHPSEQEDELPFRTAIDGLMRRRQQGVWPISVRRSVESRAGRPAGLGSARNSKSRAVPAASTLPVELVQFGDQRFRSWSNSDYRFRQREQSRNAAKGNGLVTAEQEALAHVPPVRRRFNKALAAAKLAVRSSNPQGTAKPKTTNPSYSSSAAEEEATRASVSADEAGSALQAASSGSLPDSLKNPVVVLKREEVYMGSSPAKPVMPRPRQLPPIQRSARVQPVDISSDSGDDNDDDGTPLKSVAASNRVRRRDPALSNTRMELYQLVEDFKGWSFKYPPSSFSSRWVRAMLPCAPPRTGLQLRRPRAITETARMEQPGMLDDAGVEAVLRQQWQSLRPLVDHRTEVERVMARMPYRTLSKLVLDANWFSDETMQCIIQGLLYCENLSDLRYV